MTDVVLGHPYSAALYAFFSDQLGGTYSHTKSAATHSYYRTLYGNDYKENVELALTFLILYDNVWLTPADSFFPKSKVAPDSQFIVPELQLNASWEDWRLGYQYREAAIKRYLEDLVLQRLLGAELGIPRSAWSMLLNSAVYDAHLSVKKRCSLLCSAGRRAVIERLIEIDRPSLVPTLSGLHEVEFVQSYRTVMGLALVPKSIDQLMESKLHPQVRAYSSGFLDVVLAENGAVKPADVRRVAQLIRDAMETEKTAKMYGGVLKWAGMFFKLFHSPAISVGNAALTATARHISERAGWYEFGGCIDRLVDRKTLSQNVEKLCQEASEDS